MLRVKSWSGWLRNRWNLGGTRRRRAARSVHSLEVLESRALLAAQLQITPITWNTVGLDSNTAGWNQGAPEGPNVFLVGARITNTGDTAATDLAANFVWDEASPMDTRDAQNPIEIISLSTGSLSTLTLGNLAVGESRLAFFNVEVARDKTAGSSSTYFTKSRDYRITTSATDSNDSSTVSAATPAGREIYVERLISQNRNGISSIIGPTSVSPGDTVVFTVNSFTATGGYEELQDEVVFPNQIFQIERIQAVYNKPVTNVSPSVGTAANPNSTVFANPGDWDENPSSPTYRTALNTDNTTNKAGGDPIQTKYTLKVIGEGSWSVSDTLRDFSGSSYHYNSDFGKVLHSGVSSAANTQQHADLSISKSDGQTSVVPGTNTTYTLTVSNAGPIDVTGATVTDTLPAGTTFVSTTASQYSLVGNTFTCVLGTLSNGASESFDITVAIDAAATGSVTNTATVAPPDGIVDLDPSNDGADDTDLLTPEADLSLSKSNGVTSVVPGTNTTYTLTVTNAGPSTVAGATVTDTLPAGTTFVSTTASSYTLVGDTFTYTTGTLTTGGSESFSITLAIAATATGSLTNTASVVSPEGVTDTYPSNDSDEDTDPLTVQYDLGITKTDGRDAVSAGYSTNYTIVVSNAGPSAATDVLVVDNLPSGATSGSWSGNGTSGTGSISTTIATLLPGDSVTFTYTVTISASLTGTLFTPATFVNTATVAAPNDTDLSNNSATDTDSVQNGRTLGYYSNKNGQADLTGSTSGKTLRTAIYDYLFKSSTGVLANGATNSVLVNAKGQVLPLSYFSTYSNVQSFLLNATATNMASMLSAQLLATQFNIVLGRVDPNQSIAVSAVRLVAGGSSMSATLQQSLTTQPSGATAWTQVTTTSGGKATLKTALDAAILQLKSNINTTASGGNRTYQEALKNIFDGINNNQNIFC